MVPQGPKQEIKQIPKYGKKAGARTELKEKMKTQLSLILRLIQIPRNIFSATPGISTLVHKMCLILNLSALRRQGL